MKDDQIRTNDLRSFINPIAQPKPLRAAPSWTLADPKPDNVRRCLIAACLIVIIGVSSGIFLAAAPDDLARIRHACPGTAVDILSERGAVLAIRCDLGREVLP